MGESKNEPFFLNLWHWMVHWPVLTRNGKLLEHYCDKMGYPFPPEPGDMTREGQQNPYFGAMVTSVDWSLGRIVDFLNKTDDPRHPGKKLIETTYLFFSSDNGGAEQKSKEIISDNYPLKYGKKYSEEGGVRVPMVVVGPGIPAGTHFEGLVNQLDYFPTILKLTSAKITPEHQKVLSGLDISPVLTGQTQKIADEKGAERTSLFWHFPHNHLSTMKSAIREGDFKLYLHHPSGNYELYQLYENGARTDLEEKIDLAGDPDYAPVVKLMSDHLHASLKENHARGPYRNPDHSPNPKKSAVITESTFDHSDRQARLRFAPAGPAIAKATILYVPDAGSKNVKHGPHGGAKVPDPAAPELGVQMPAKIGADGYSVAATIPEGVAAYRFILIDTHEFQIFGDVEATGRTR